MKKAGFGLIVVLALLLCGCSRAEAAWETVDDAEIMAASGSWLDSAYTMVFSVPQDAVEDTTASGRDCTVYTQADGGYEIERRTMLCADADSAVRRLSGFAPEQLDVIETTRFGLPEYQFAWYSETDEGARLYRADVLLDGTYAYALKLSVPESGGCQYDSTAQGVFATLGLYTDEGF